jgi:hypothetical protein
VGIYLAIVLDDKLPVAIVPFIKKLKIPLCTKISMALFNAA